MNAYLAIKFHPNFENRVIVDAISACLATLGCQTCCIIRDFESGGQDRLAPQALMKLSFEQIDRCDLLIVELTEKGVGVGIEAGYAYARGIPVYTIAPRGQPISETLAGISREVFYYQGIQDTQPFFQRILNVSS
jgi:2'-deoxynucleoside 5'-phosphate N-hydrolase